MKKLTCWLMVGLTGLVLADPAGEGAAPAQRKDAPLTYAALKALVQADYDAQGSCVGGDEWIFKTPEKSDKRQKLFRVLRYSPVSSKTLLNDGDPQIAQARSLLASYNAYAHSGSYRLHLAGLVQTFDTAELAQRYSRLKAADKLFSLPETAAFAKDWMDFSSTYLSLEEDYVGWIRSKHSKVPAEKVFLPARELALVDCWNGAQMHRWFDYHLTSTKASFQRNAAMVERWGGRLNMKYIADARAAAVANLERVKRVEDAYKVCRAEVEKLEKKGGRQQLVSDIMEIDAMLIEYAIKDVDQKIIELADKLSAKGGVAYDLLSGERFKESLSQVGAQATDSRGPLYFTASKKFVTKARRDIRAAYEQTFGTPMLLEPTKPHNVFK